MGIADDWKTEPTPLYNELVRKYYLSRGIVPFSYPHQTITVAHTPIEWQTASQPLGYFDLRSKR